MLEANIEYLDLLSQTQEQIAPLDPEKVKRDQAVLRERKVQAKKALEAHRKKEREAQEARAKREALKAEKQRLDLEANQRANVMAAAEDEARALFDRVAASDSNVRNKVVRLTDEQIMELRKKAEL